MRTKLLLTITLTSVLFSGCKTKHQETIDYSRFYSDSIHQRLASAVIYEVNIRQITPEGTFKAFTDQHIDRLKKLGVDVLWLMPIYPISVKNRKGTLGSYYSVADYKGVNPEFGTLDDLKELVNQAHKAGMLVIFDWVANHTGWDNPWVTDHPEWYTRNEKGKIIPPVPDWSDVADLNYENPELWKTMVDALEYWVREVGIDGYRCDAAAMAPTGFWKEALLNIDSLRPVIKLAEAWEPELMASGFDAAYGWEFHHLMNSIAKGEMNLGVIEDYMTKTDSMYADDDMLMNFITNHDENSWAGTEYERMGKYVQGFAALTYLMPGIPMLYNGQEAGLRKRLLFFEKDMVNWSDTSLYGFYRILNSLKHRNPSLMAGLAAGTAIFAVDTTAHTLTIQRSKGDEIVLGLFNFSDREAELSLTMLGKKGKYTEVFHNNKYKLKNTSQVTLKPWEFLILEKK